MEFTGSRRAFVSGLVLAGILACQTGPGEKGQQGKGQPGKAQQGKDKPGGGKTGGGASTQDAPNPDAPDAAAQASALASLKSLVTNQNFARLGFQSAAEAASAVFGTPIRQYLVRPGSVSGFQGSTDPASILEDTEQWLYPVTVNGMVRCLVTIARRQNGWQTIGYGDQGLAQALFGLRSSERTRLRLTSDGSFFLIDVPVPGQKFLGRRTDGRTPSQAPGRGVVEVSWLGNPPAGLVKTSPAERVFRYLAGEVLKTKGGAPGR